MNKETLKNETLFVKGIIKEPIKEHVQILYNHFSRYNSAIRLLDISNNDIVIDSSCGHGYGSYILSLKAKKVLGLDINSDYIKTAKELFDAENLEFYLYDEYDALVATGNEKANKIVCIETFEHIPKDEIINFIKKLLLYLEDNGSMFLTVPLGNNEASSYNPSHLNEPGIDYIYDLFKSYFRAINFEISKFINSFRYETNYCYIILKNPEKNK